MTTSSIPAASKPKGKEDGAPGTKIEITPKMIEAGWNAYYDLDHYRGDSPINDESLAAIYRAMKAAEPFHPPSSSAKHKSENSADARGATTIHGIRTFKGEKMLKGSWKLVSPHFLEFPATLIETINIGKTRLAIFSVPKRKQQR